MALAARIPNFDAQFRYLPEELHVKNIHFSGAPSSNRTEPGTDKKILNWTITLECEYKPSSNRVTQLRLARPPITARTTLSSGTTRAASIGNTPLPSFTQVVQSTTPPQAPILSVNIVPLHGRSTTNSRALPPTVSHLPSHNIPTTTATLSAPVAIPRSRSTSTSRGRHTTRKKICYIRLEASIHKDNRVQFPQAPIQVSFRLIAREARSAHPTGTPKGTKFSMTPACRFTMAKVITLIRDKRRGHFLPDRNCNGDLRLMKAILSDMVESELVAKDSIIYTQILGLKPSVFGDSYYIPDDHSIFL